MEWNIHKLLLFNPVHVAICMNVKECVLPYMSTLYIGFGS